MDKSGKNRYYEGCGKEGPILCIFLCEFHSTYGPKISCQVPKDFITKETFESVNVYLIPKPQLIRSIITVTLGDIKIVGYPVRIESQIYPRNAFYYNLCFVCNSWARTVQYDQVVKDFSAYLRKLEEEKNFLSKMDNDGCCSLTAMLAQVLSDLNSQRLSTVTEGKRTVHLKVGRFRTREVASHSVPILATTLHFSTWTQLDQNTLQLTNKILQHVDGLNHVDKIATLAGVDVEQVKTCLQNLINNEVVSLVPMYGEGCCYVATPRIRRLFLDRQLQSDCLSHISSASPGGLPSVRDVLRVYCALNQGATVRDICHRFDMVQMRIDEMKLIQFGLLHEIIRKLNKHPNYVEEAAGVTTSGVTATKEDAKLYEELNGINCYEEIVCKTGCTVQCIDQLVNSDPRIFTIYK